MNIEWHKYPEEKPDYSGEDCFVAWRSDEGDELGVELGYYHKSTDVFLTLYEENEIFDVTHWAYIEIPEYPEDE